MVGNSKDYQDDYNVELKVETVLNPSEDPEKVRKCILNVANGCHPNEKSGSMEATCTGILSLHHIRVGIRSKSSSAVLRKLLEWNRKGNLSWFYLNKQAAYNGVISLVERYEESPLGPIKVTISSNNLDKITEWLLSSKQ
ncbi:MAG TPA: RNA-binding domain-containing protein [Nitrososphaeraceae archaeon]